MKDFGMKDFGMKDSTPSLILPASPILSAIRSLWEFGEADRAEDGCRRLYPLRVKGEAMQAQCYTSERLALVVVVSVGRKSQDRKSQDRKAQGRGGRHFRNLLVDSFGDFGPRGRVYLETVGRDGQPVAVPHSGKYQQAASDVMAMRADKRPVRRPAGSAREEGAAHV